jgi:hypothetical protein
MAERERYACLGRGEVVRIFFSEMGQEKEVLLGSVPYGIIIGDDNVKNLETSKAKLKINDSIRFDSIRFDLI